MSRQVQAAGCVPEHGSAVGLSDSLQVVEAF